MPRLSRIVPAQLLVGAIAFGAASTLAHAQDTGGFTACTSGALSNCAVVRLSNQLGIGAGGLNLFTVALTNLGSATAPSVATSIYNVVFATSHATAVPGTEVDAAVSPVAVAGATLSDDSAWGLFDSGDAIFLSALSNNGVGGCVAGAAVGGFGQAGNTCGSDQALTFSFFTSRTYDLSAFTLFDLEVVGLADGLPSDGCNNSDNACVLSAAPVTATPEPATLVLTATGLLSILGARRRRRHALVTQTAEG